MKLKTWSKDGSTSSVCTFIKLCTYSLINVAQSIFFFKILNSIYWGLMWRVLWCYYYHIFMMYWYNRRLQIISSFSEERRCLVVSRCLACLILDSNWVSVFKCCKSFPESPWRREPGKLMRTDGADREQAAKLWAEISRAKALQPR